MAKMFHGVGNDRLNMAKSSVLDLSGSAVAQEVIAHFLHDAQIESINLLYTEASSADTGVLLKVGKEGDDDFFYTGTSEVSKAQWYETTVPKLQSIIKAGDSLTVSCAGGKVGTGNVVITVLWSYLR